LMNKIYDKILSFKCDEIVPFFWLKIMKPYQLISQTN